MSDSKIKPEHHVKVDISIRGGLEIEQEQQVERAKLEKKPVAEPRLAPRTFALPGIAVEEKPVEAAYQEHLERLEEVIKEQAVQVAEEVKQIAEEQGLQPSDVTLIWAVDITGKQDVVCSFCGRPSCNFRPVMYRTKNPEVDLLGDAITVFQEAASRAGVKYGIIAYDEEVAVLREPAVPEDQAERGSTLSNYTKFRDRHEYPDPKSRGWLDAMLRKWNPADANRRMAGDPADGRMFETGFKLFEQAGGAVKAMMVVKGAPSRVALRGVELRAKAQGIGLTGMAVGKRADEVAEKLLSNTIKAPDPHELREKVAEGISASLESVERKGS